MIWAGPEPGSISSRLFHAGCIVFLPLVCRKIHPILNVSNPDFHSMGSFNRHPGALFKNLLSSENIPSGLFCQMLDSMNMKRTGFVLSQREWNRTKPVLFLSGENDPVSYFGRGALRVKQFIDKAVSCSVLLRLLRSPYWT